MSEQTNVSGSRLRREILEPKLNKAENFNDWLEAVKEALTFQDLDGVLEEDKPATGTQETDTPITVDKEPPTLLQQKKIKLL